MMKKRYQRTALPQYLIAGTLILIAIGIGLGSTMIMETIPFEDHFVIPWAAGRGWLLEGQNPYDSAIIDLASSAIAETSFLGELPRTEQFDLPLVTLFLYLPFSLIPYQISRAIWMSVQVISVLLIGFVSLKLSAWKLSNGEVLLAIILLLAWLPSVNGIVNGQLSPLIILLVFAGIYLLLNGQATTAGFFLALTFGSFPTTFFILLFLVIWSIMQHHWSFLGAYFAGIAFLIAISVILMPSWPLDWLGILLQKFEGLESLQTPLMNFANALPGIASYLMIFLHAGVILYLLLIWIRRKEKPNKDLIWRLLFTFVAAYLLHIEANLTHLLLTVPALFFVFRFWTERWGLLGRIVSWLLLLLIVVTPWLEVVNAIDFSKEITLPFLLIGFPILVLIGLISVKWWAVKVPKLPFENR